MSNTNLPSGLVILWSISDGPFNADKIMDRTLPSPLDSITVTDRASAFWSATDMGRTGYTPLSGKNIRTETVGSTRKQGVLKRIIYVMDVDENNIVLETTQVGHVWCDEENFPFKFVAYDRIVNGKRRGYLGDNVEPTNMALEYMYQKYNALFGDVQGRKIREGLTACIKSDAGIPLRAKGGVYLVPTPVMSENYKEKRDKYYNLAKWVSTHDMGEVTILDFFGKNHSTFDSIISWAAQDLDAERMALQGEVLSFKNSNSTGKVRINAMQRLENMKVSLENKYLELSLALDTKLMPHEALLNFVDEALLSFVDEALSAHVEEKLLESYAV
jgi:hypothetical protein